MNQTSNARLDPSKPSFLSEEPRLPLPFWAWRPGGRLPRLVLLVEPAVNEGPDQGAGGDTASKALAAQSRVDALFEAHRYRLSQASHLRLKPYTSRPLPATDRSGPTQSCVSFDAVYMFTTEARSHFLPISASAASDHRLRSSEIRNARVRFIRRLRGTLTRLRLRTVRPRRECSDRLSASIGVL
jgi:hypothetical protein